MEQVVVENEGFVDLRVCPGQFFESRRLGAELASYNKRDDDCCSEGSPTHPME